MQGGDTVKIHNAGLPEIKGAISAVRFNPGEVQTPTGCFADSKYNTVGQTLSLPNVSGSNNAASCIIAFNASDSEPIYGNAKTVQPPALSLIPQIRY